MNFDDVKLIKHHYTGANRFGFWVHLRDRRPVALSSGRLGKKTIRKFIEQNLGPMGEKWQYEKFNTSDYFLKLNDEKDFLFFLLRLQ